MANISVFKRLKEHYERGIYQHDEIVNIIAEGVFELDQRVQKLEKKKVVPKKLRGKEPEKKGLFHSLKKKK